MKRTEKLCNTILSTETFMSVHFTKNQIRKSIKIRCSTSAKFPGKIINPSFMNILIIPLLIRVWIQNEILMTGILPRANVKRVLREEWGSWELCEKEEKKRNGNCSVTKEKKERKRKRNERENFSSCGAI